MKEKEYHLNIDPQILKTLGPQLYTNIYYVLSELVANSYDADANNVWLTINTLNKNVVVEDDGIGMSYDDLNNKYLIVAKESRIDEESKFTPSGKRAKMGRKGIGKLASLSASEDVYIMTLKNGLKNGLILSINMRDDKLLKSIPEDDISFSDYINKIGHGTKVEMRDVKINLPKHAKSIAKNLSKMLPVFSSDFKLHIKLDSETLILDNSGLSSFDDLVTLSTFGMSDDDIKILKENNKNLTQKFTHSEDPINVELQILDKKGNLVSKNLRIVGWIGTMLSTVGTKKEIQDFSENFISVYANKKMGMFNILPLIGKNKLIESYVRGQLNVDIFEDSDLPDMALSNREGYQSTDVRWKAFLDKARTMLDDAINLRVKYNVDKNSEKELKKQEKLRQKDARLKELVNKTKEDINKELMNTLGKNNSFDKNDIDLSDATSKVIYRALDLKEEITDEKKKLLISHSRNDKSVVNLIYDFLKFNGVDNKSIIYSSSDDDVAVLPEGADIFEYLRDFFVKSITKDDMFVIYVVSENMQKSWNAATEAGAGWITKTNDKIVVINRPGKEIKEPNKPLNSSKKFSTINLDANEDWNVSDEDLVDLVRSLSWVVKQLGLEPKDKEQNIKWFKKRI